MDRVTKFIFAVGTLDGIKTGNFNENTFHADNLELAKQHFPKKGVIIVPYLIGVYQLQVFTPQKEEEKGKVDFYNQLTLEGGLDLLFDYSLAKTGRRSGDLNPHIIQIGYDPTIERRIFEEMLASPISRRLVIAPYPELSDKIYEKPLADIEDWRRKTTKTGEKILAALNKGNKARAKSLFKDHKQMYEKIMVEFGLTQDEYVGLLDHKKFVELAERKDL